MGADNDQRARQTLSAMGAVLGKKSQNETLESGDKKSIAGTKCGTCSNVLMPDAKFCRKCGSAVNSKGLQKPEVPKVKCGKCAKPSLQQGSKSCKLCGWPAPAEIAKDVEVPKPVPPDFTPKLSAMCVRIASNAKYPTKDVDGQEVEDDAVFSKNVIPLKQKVKEALRERMQQVIYDKDGAHHVYQRLDHGEELDAMFTKIKHKFADGSDDLSDEAFFKVIRELFMIKKSDFTDIQILALADAIDVQRKGEISLKLFENFVRQDVEPRAETKFRGSRMISPIKYGQESAVAPELKIYLNPNAVGGSKVIKEAMRTLDTLAKRCGMGEKYLLEIQLKLREFFLRYVRCDGVLRRWRKINGFRTLLYMWCGKDDGVICYKDFSDHLRKINVGLDDLTKKELDAILRALDTKEIEMELGMSPTSTKPRTQNTNLLNVEEWMKYMIRMPVTVMRLVQNKIATAALVKGEDKWISIMNDYLRTQPGHVTLLDLLGICRVALKIPVKDLPDYEIRLMFETLLDQHPECTSSITLTTLVEFVSDGQHLVAKAPDPEMNRVGMRAMDIATALDDKSYRDGKLDLRVAKMREQLEGIETKVLYKQARQIGVPQHELDRLLIMPNPEEALSEAIVGFQVLQGELLDAGSWSEECVRDGLYTEARIGGVGYRQKQPDDFNPRTPPRTPRLHEKYAYVEHEKTLKRSSSSPPAAMDKRVSELRRDATNASRHAGVVRNQQFRNESKYGGQPGLEAFPDATRHEVLKKAVHGYTAHIPGSDRIPELGFNGRKQAALSQGHWKRIMKSPRVDASNGLERSTQLCPPWFPVDPICTF